jgi:hypothetical protein
MAFPVVQATATGRITTASTSHSITLPAGIQTGELLFVILAIDPSTAQQVDMNVSSGTGWYKWNWGHDGTLLSSTVFWKYATGSDALTISSDSSQTSAHFSARISGAKSFSADLTTGDTNDASGTYGGRGRGYEILNLVVNVNDGNLTAVTPPTGYTLLTSTSSPLSTTGASIAAASRTSYGSRDPGEDPGPWATYTAGNTSRNTWHFAFNETEWDNPSGIVGRQETKNVTAITSHTVRMPGNVQPGDVIEVFAGFNSTATISVNTGSSGNGWIIVAQASYSTVGPTGFICYKIATGSDALVLTSSVSTTSNAISSIWKGVAHITGGMIGGIAGSAADPDLAESSASGNYNATTSTGFGGNWDQSLIVGAYYVHQTTAGVWGDGGARISNAGQPTIAYSAIPFIVYGANNLSWSNWSTTPTNNWVVGVATRWPTYSRQIRLVGRDSVAQVGGTGTATRAFSNLTYLAKFNANEPIGQTTVSFSVDGIRPGDMVLVANCAGTANRNPNLAITGYTLLANVYSNGSANDTRVWAGYKFMGQTVDTGITYPRSANTADAQSLIYMVIRGIDPDNVVDGEVIIRSGTGTGRPTDYARTTWRGAAAARTSPLLSSVGNNYVRIAAGAAATSVALVPPTDNWSFQSQISADTIDVHALMSYVFPTSAPEGWSNTAPTDRILTTGWTGGTTGTGDSWVEVIVPFNALKRPIHGGILKVWNGTAWVPQDIRVYNGTQWGRNPVKHWNGTRWVTFTTNQFD